MMECKLGATPGLLLDRPIGLLALHGRDGEDDAKSDKSNKSDDDARSEEDDTEEDGGKDGEDGMKWGFKLDVVQLGLDEDLDPITSCVVTEVDLPVGGVAERTLGPNELVVNAVIQEFAQAQTEGIEVGPVIAEAVRRMPPPTDGKRDTRKQRARRALENLCAGDSAPYWLGDDGCIAVC